MRKWIPAGLLIALLAIGVIVLVGRHPTGSGSSSGSEVTGPREAVRGVQGIQQPRSTPEDEKVAVAALNAAADYAAAHQSTALIVSRHGHIIFERYWGGASRDTEVDSGAFARTVAAMLVGIALDERHISSADEPVATVVDSFGNGAQAQMTIRELMQAQDVQPMVQLIEKLTGKRYAEFLSRELWKPLFAGDASMVLDRPGGLARADCCMRARQGDWLRVGELLLTDGQYQGSTLLPRGWAQLMASPSSRDPARGAQLALGIPRDGFYLEGPGKSRLWLHPTLHLAVLRVGAEPKEWDEGKIPGLVIAGVSDRPRAPADPADLSRLVPHH